MTKHENIPIPEEFKEIDNCKKAIEIYWRGYYEFSKVNSSQETERDILTMSFNDAEDLAQGTDMRYGAPGYGDAKLEYGIPLGQEEKLFYIKANGMNEREFNKWQSFIGKKFEKNDLKFYYF